MSYTKLIARHMAALALTTAVVFPALAQTDKDADPVKGWVETFRTNHQFNGTIVVRNDGKVNTYPVGVARPNDGVMNAATTTYNLAQAGEQFTAAAVLKLQEQGKLKLDDEIAKTLPELAAYQGVTVYHLLAHSSGIPGYETLVAINSSASAKVTNKEVIALFKKSPLPSLFRAGERVQYSSSDYAVLATLVERVSGTDFEKFVVDNVFKPAGMNTASFTPGASSAQPLKLRYVGGPEVLMPLTWQVLGNDGVYASATDLAAWDQALTSGKVSGAKQVFEASKTKLGAANYGFSWALGTAGSAKIATLEGQNSGFRTLYRRTIDGKRSIIVLSNTNNPKLADLADGIDAILAGQKPVQPRISIAHTIAKTFGNGGAAAALQQYNALKAGDRGTYDFRESELNQLGHELLAAGRTDDAIAIFKANVDTYPKSFNTHDSLGEAYAAAGKTKEAIIYYRNSLALYSDNDVAREALRKLQASQPKTE